MDIDFLYDNLTTIGKNNKEYIFKSTKKNAKLFIEKIMSDIHIKFLFNQDIEYIKIYYNNTSEKILSPFETEIIVNRNSKIKIRFYFKKEQSIVKLYIDEVYNIYNKELFINYLKKYVHSPNIVNNKFDYLFYINFYDEYSNMSSLDACEFYKNYGIKNNHICNLGVFMDLYNLKKINLEKFNKIKNNKKLNLIELLYKKYTDFDYDFYVNFYKNDFALLNLNKYEKAIKHYYFVGQYQKRIYNKHQMNSNKLIIKKMIDDNFSEQKNKISTHCNIFSVLTRSNKRPNCFKKIYNIIKSQKYDLDKINLIVSYHNQTTYDYLKPYKNIKMIEVVETTVVKSIKNPYPYNIYLNDLIENVIEDSWVIFIDDDDVFTNQYSFHTINYEIEKIKKTKNDNNFALFWRVVRCDQLLGDIAYGTSNLSSQILPLCGFAIHSSKLNLFKFNTERVAYQIQKLQGKIDIFWSKYVLTEIGQEDTIAGFGFTEI